MLCIYIYYVNLASFVWRDFKPMKFKLRQPVVSLRKKEFIKRENDTLSRNGNI